MGIEPTTFGPEPIVLPLNYHPLIRQGRTDWNLPRRVVVVNPRIVQDALGPRVTVHLCLRRSMLMETRHRIEGHTVRTNRRVRYEVGGIVMQQHGLFCCTPAQAGGPVLSTAEFAHNSAIFGLWRCPHGPGPTRVPTPGCRPCPATSSGESMWSGCWHSPASG